MAGRGALWMMAVLMGTVLAGCLGAGEGPPAPDMPEPEPAAPGTYLDRDLLTRPEFGLLPQQTFTVTSSLDGIALFVEVYLPDGEGPWPTIIENSPYYATAFNGELRDDTGHRLRDFFVPRGYAVVLAHVRGTGNSEGCMDMMGPKEQSDTYDLVEWVAAQSWSDGLVGMDGFSYVGTTPHEALIMAPPHLTTVAAGAGVTNQWRNTFQNGVPYQGRHYPLTYEVLTGAPPPTNVEAGASWALNVAAAACDQEEAIQEMAPGTYELGVYSPYWDARNLTKGARSATASILYFQGMADRAVNPMEALGWFNDLDVPKKAILHQAGHSYPDRADFLDLRHAWFDHWLKGIENGVMDGHTVEVSTNHGMVRVDDAWPPVDVNRTHLWLTPTRLVEAPPADGQQTYVADLTRGQHDAYHFEADPTHEDWMLEFTTAPFTRPMYLAGPIWFHLVAGVDAENTYFLSDVYEVDDDGWDRLAEGWMNAHLHEGFDQSSPLTPRQTYTFRFKFEPLDRYFDAGDRLGLRIVGHDERVFPVDEPRTLNTVYFGQDGSRLEVPFLEAPRLLPEP